MITVLVRDFMCANLDKYDDWVGPKYSFANLEHDIFCDMIFSFASLKLYDDYFCPTKYCCKPRKL